jgi:Mg-chelatase subunit ChlD
MAAVGRLAVVAVSIVAGACAQSGNGRDGEVREGIDAALTPVAAAPARPGLAAAVVVDVSGSMERRAKGDADGATKIEVARRSAVNLVDQFVRYATDHPAETVQLGIWEFSTRDGQPPARPIVPMGVPDLERAQKAVGRMDAEGGTPIGEAMIAAKLALDATGLSRRHLLVITDGENTDGPAPEAVARAIGRRPEAERPSMYFVAFDVDARRFDAVREANTIVLAASTGRGLGDTINSLLRGQVLIER